MAGPQFFSPPGVTPSRPKKRFTLAEANKSLPYVSRVVNDLVSTHQAVLNLQNKVESSPNAKDRTTAEKEFEIKKDRFQGLLDELNAVGAQLKDARSGLIDFIGKHKGHEVCLCWRLGESKVAFFHEIESGFAGRQPVSTLDESR